MNIVGVLACSVAAIGAAIVLPPTAQAGSLQCVSTNGTQMTMIDVPAACGTESDPTGSAAAFGLDGIGYAKAISGGTALGIGALGGIGAGEGQGGLLTALGIGPDSVAIASVSDGSFSVALALASSQALVADADQGVLCQGSSAFAWNMRSGAACLATGLGMWSTR